jgi:hypothetical protein
MPWLTGDFLPEFAPELASSFLLALEKPNGDIRDISPVDIFRRAQGHAIVQAVQPLAAKTRINSYSSFKQLALSKDDASHFLYLLNDACYDPAFISAADADDRPYSDSKSCHHERIWHFMPDTRPGCPCRQSVSQLRMGHQTLMGTCETILRFYSYDGTDKYIKCRTRGLPGD